MAARVYLVCEGRSDLAFLARLVEYVGAEVCGDFIQNGVANLDKKISAYCEAASVPDGAFGWSYVTRTESARLIFGRLCSVVPAQAAFSSESPTP